MIARISIVLALLALACPGSADYSELVLKDRPVAYWRLDEKTGVTVGNAGTSKADLSGRIVGGLRVGESAQRPPEFPGFTTDSTAIRYSKARNYIVVKDPGERSDLDFHQGDAITLEAWVNPEDRASSRFLYVIGKGRTQNRGVVANNQNYALRLTGSGAITFLFRNAKNRPGVDSDWHRWTSTSGFSTDAEWHHVALTYTFGDGNSLRGYIDGKPVKGKWDKGGKTDDGPYVDNDELWIGSAIGGNPDSGFHGLLNEVAIYRQALSAERIGGRFRHVPQKHQVALGMIPDGKVLAELIENIPVAKNFDVGRGKKTASFELEGFGLTRLPFKYNSRGIRSDRSTAMLLRLSANIVLPKGKHELLLRALNGSRLFVDGQSIGSTKFNVGNTSGHGKVSPIPSRLPDGLRFMRLGHDEKYVVWESDGKPHLFTHKIYLGGKSRKPDVGEASVSMLGADGKEFRLLAPEAQIVHSDAGWKAYAERLEEKLDAIDRQTRRAAATAQDHYWQRRHQEARSSVAAMNPVVVPAGKAASAIDRFIDAKLRKDGKHPVALTDEHSFLRRVAIDLTGRIPARDTIDRFRALPEKKRRAKIIDHLLQDPGWADNWVAYWQDVLAENPAILKPSLNNTGPFRFFIHEAFSDNLGMDRFASELIMMEGSTYGGGAGGFKLATQNDAPLADRALIVSQAFLGQNLACARCHDSPFHEHTQQQTFQLAAMLNRSPLTVPKTSSLPTDANPRARRKIELSIKPGDRIKPGWAFPRFSKSDLKAAYLQSPNDTREQLAVHVTNPANIQFARTIVNRAWKRYFGFGIVEPADDWEDAIASHPDLLEWLAREFVSNGYNLKWLARMIMTSKAYQRRAIAGDDLGDDHGTRWFASPQRRRMSAEQLLDSVFAAIGKDLDTELLTLDNDYRRPMNTFLNLGRPKRAWEFTTLSNDRDRPALSMPKTQAVIDLLKEFGWRETRQGARTQRDDSPNVLQPALLANGEVGNGRVARLSDDCEITEISVRSVALKELVTDVFERALTRPPSQDELEMFVELLKPGFEQRVILNPKRKSREYDQSLLLSWSNHLNAKSTAIKMALEEKLRRGDEPTPRLVTDWRERMEDMLWASLNSPEFIFIP
ncbi:MAG: hypothetical protein ACI9OD_003503 [Limisphaerales bacterium]|jgi:hypothetical protein